MGKKWLVVKLDESKHYTIHPAPPSIIKLS